MIESFTEALGIAIRSEIRKVHTCIPGIVSTYDPSGPSIEVQPAVRTVLQDGTAVSLPVVVEVPVIFPRTSRFHLSFPLEAGDNVLILFTERSIEEFLNSGKESTPKSQRAYHLTDAVAIPGCFGMGRGSKVTDGDKLEIVFDQAKLVSDGKDFEMTGNLKVTGKIEASGEVAASDFNVGAGLTFNGHGHPSPAGPTGLPVVFVPPVPTP